MLFRVICVGLVALTLLAGVSAAQPLRIATGDYPPFTGADLPEGGLVNHTVAEMAARAGLEVVFDYMPWKRGLELARSGRYAATSFWYYSADRASDFIHVGPIFEDRLVFFHLRGTEVPAWDGLQDLSGLRIGAVAGYTFTPEFWALAEAGVLTVELAPNDGANFRKLLAGRIDLYPMSDESGWTLIADLFDAGDRDRFTTLDRPLAVTHGYLLVSRAWPKAEELAEDLNAALPQRSPDPSAQAARDPDGG